jgi:DNA-binding NtrC family response regulator
MLTHSTLIFVVEDNEWYRKLLVHSLESNPDFRVESFATGEEFLGQIGRNPDIVSLDFRLPDTKGDVLLRKIKNHNEEIEVLIISEQEDIETAVDLLKKGAFDYLVKEKDIRNKLLQSIKHIQDSRGLKSEIRKLKKEVQKSYNFNSIVGDSPEIKNIFSIVEKSLDTNINVSITGETGTGKELIAKTIHFNSKFKAGPFVPVNMAAIPQELVESELFGHEKGAFTGATARRIGKFEEASGGTLFLDEIGEMDINIQAKILRVLQEKELVRVGGTGAVRIDCRIITATNLDLLEEVREQRFRDDLYYRIKGIPIHLPPLRIRPSDVILLAQYFITLFCRENNLPNKYISKEAKNKLDSYAWPGNIRELKSVIELAIVMSVNEVLQADDISIDSREHLSELLGQDITMREYNQRLVNVFMKKYNNNTKLVSKKLDIGQTTVYRLLKESS